MQWFKFHVRSTQCEPQCFLFKYPPNSDLLQRLLLGWFIVLRVKYGYGGGQRNQQEFFLDVRMEEEKLKRDRRIKKSLLVNTRVYDIGSRCDGYNMTFLWRNSSFNHSFFHYEETLHLSKLSLHLCKTVKTNFPCLQGQLKAHTKD